MMDTMRRSTFLATACGLALLAGCAGESQSGAADTQAAANQVGRAMLHDAWVRPADSAAMSAAYFVLRSGSDSLTIVGASSPAARAAEVHESMQHEGMMHMQPRPSLAVAPGDSLVFAPGGLHVMLIDLLRPLNEGDTVTLLLRTSSGDSLVVTAPVRRP
jgi:periplasmic copper chaperone A